MKKNPVIILFCLFFFSLVASSNNRKEWDVELNSILANDNISDSLKITLISDLFLENSNSLDNMNLKTFLDNAALLPKRTMNNDELRAYIYSSAIILINDIDQKLPILDSSIFYLGKVNNPEIRSIGWTNIGKMQIKDIRSLKYFQRALNEIEGKEYHKLEMEIYQNIAAFYGLRGDHTNHIKYAKLTLESAQKGVNKIDLVKAWNDLAIAYYEIPTDDFNNDALNAFNEALSIYKEVIQTDEYGSDDFLYLIVCMNLAKVYNSKGEFDTAIIYLNDALIIAIQNNIPEYQITCYRVFATVERNKGEYLKAEEYLLKAESLLSEISHEDEENLSLLYGIYFDLAALYSQAGNKMKAAQYMQIGLEEYQKVFDLQLAYDSQLLTASYEVQKKEGEVEAIQSIITLKDKQTYLLIGIIFILIVGSFFILKLFKYKVSIAKQSERYKLDEIELLKLEKSHVILKNNLKLKESNQLQKQLALGNILLDHNNQIFENLKEFFATHSDINKYKSQVESILIQQSRIESNVEDLKNISEDVPVDFYSHLQNHANNKLSILDLKYCRLIYLKISTKEMADTLFVDVNTIRVSKYRLKQKLNLKKDDDLSLFIEDIANKSI